jgi:hypothetical protein
MLNKIDTSNYEEPMINNIICVIMCLFDDLLCDRIGCEYLSVA